jgi:ABC-type glutathione transport system ATPase component
MSDLTMAEPAGAAFDAACGATPVVEWRGVGVSYRKGPAWRRSRVPALKCIDLAIAPGETLGLVGESGSGKTTLGRVALGLIAPSSGRLLFDGRPVDTALRRQGRLSVVFQHPEWALNPRLKCGISLAEPLSIQGGIPPAERLLRVGSMLQEVGLDPGFAQRYPGELSGGQRQRMAIARALVTRPRFIVFDEAVSALDVSVQSQILNLIQRLQAQYGFAALFISHDLAATRYVAHRIAVMRKGELVEVGPALRFYGPPYGQPEHAYSRELYATLA